MNTKPRRQLALKSIGRKKITFHLDQLVFLGLEDDGTYSYFCEMAESQVRVYGTGVVCGHSELGFETQEEAEEAALEHLQQMHQAMGGTKRPQGRGKIRREREIAAWNARHGKTINGNYVRKDPTTDD